MTRRTRPQFLLAAILALGFFVPYAVAASFPPQGSGGGGGGGDDLSTVLAAGNTTGGTDLVVSSGDNILGDGSLLRIQGGDSKATAGTGTDVFINAQQKTGSTGDGGDVTVFAGGALSTSSGNGGKATFSGGDVSSASGGNGGVCDIEGGDAQAGTGNGGDVTIRPGSSVGGTAGTLYLQSGGGSNIVTVDATGMRFLTYVEANTAVAASPNTITASESGKVFTNEGATAENHHDLPTASAGLTYTFVCEDADGIQINVGTGDTIYVGGTASTAGTGSIETTTQMAAVTLIATNADTWVARDVTGTWTVN